MKDQSHNFLPDITPSRRSFLVTSISTGFALAALPAAASTVTTSVDGLDAGPISVPASGGTVPGYQARKKGAKGLPTVLVVQEIFGLHEHIQDVCRRLAHEGYHAISVELYARYGDTSNMSGFPEILEVVKKVPDAEVMADLDAAVAFAATQGADTSKLAVTGFCWGGRIVWLYAAHRVDLDAGVAWYGRLRGDASANNPKQPIEVAGAMKAPVLGLYAGKDKGIPVADVEAMDAALTAAGKPHAFEVYAEAEHGFHADYRASYDPIAAKDGWSRMLAWFRSHGVG